LSFRPFGEVAMESFLVVVGIIAILTAAIISAIEAAFFVRKVFETADRVDDLRKDLRDVVEASERAHGDLSDRIRALEQIKPEVKS
jgi:hypothetical protein